MNQHEAIARKFSSLAGVLDERGRRLWAAAEARELGWGGQTLVSKATGIARHTIRAGMRELEGTRAGTSKWKKIEHKMFYHIKQQFRGRPLLSREVVVELIAHTKTRAGLRVHAELDETIYLKGKSISDEEMAALNIHRHEFHGESIACRYSPPHGTRCSAVDSPAAQSQPQAAAYRRCVGRLWTVAARVFR